MEGRGRPGRRAAGDRCRQLRRRGLRAPEAGRRPTATPSASGYHPILATRADTREALHIRLRKGSANTQKGMLRFTDELIARVSRAGATGVKLLRADSGFWNTKVFERLERAGWQYSIGVRMIKTVRAAVEAIPEDAWHDDRRLPRRRRGADRRDHLRRPPADRPAHPPARRPGRAVARLAALRVSSPTAPTTSRSSRPSTASTPSSSRSSPTSKTRPWRTSPPATTAPTPPGPCSPPSPTTCSDGRSCSGCPTRPSAPPAPCAADCSSIPGRLTRHARGWTLHLPPAGPGTATTSARSTASARSPPPDSLTALAPTTSSTPDRPPGADHGCPPTPHTPPERVKEPPNRSPAPPTDLTAAGHPPSQPVTPQPISRHPPSAIGGFGLRRPRPTSGATRAVSRG